jgi:hypothetical protein
MAKIDVLAGYGDGASPTEKTRRIRDTMWCMDRVDLRFDCGSVTWAFDDVQFFPAVGGIELRFAAKVSATWLTENDAAQLLVTGHVASSPELGAVGYLPSQVVSLRGYPLSESIGFFVSDDQILRLEAKRQQQSVDFLFNITGTVLSTSSTATQTVQITLRIPASRWLEGLDTSGHLLGLAIQLAAPLLDARSREQSEAVAASATQVVDRLRQARRELADGRYESCVATCRLALDSLATLKPPLSKKPIDAKAAQTRSQAERWAVLQHDLHSLLSGAHHDDEITKPFTWNRQDAEAILVAVAGLCARQLQTKE